MPTLVPQTGLSCRSLRSRPVVAPRLVQILHSLENDRLITSSDAIVLAHLAINQDPQLVHAYDLFIEDGDLGAFFTTLTALQRRFVATSFQVSSLFDHKSDRATCVVVIRAPRSA
jgi:hypothetical protein